MSTGQLSSEFLVANNKQQSGANKKSHLANGIETFYEDDRNGFNSFTLISDSAEDEIMVSSGDFAQGDSNAITIDDESCNSQLQSPMSAQSGHKLISNKTQQQSASLLSRHTSEINTNTNNSSNQSINNCKRVASETVTNNVATSKTNSTTSNSQRLSSIEILNENKQRQLQFKQQEPFKQHVVQRQQQLIHKQQQQELQRRRHQSSSISSQGQASVSSQSDTQKRRSSSSAEPSINASSSATNNENLQSSAKISKHLNWSSSASSTNEELDPNDFDRDHLENQLDVTYQVNTSAPDYMTSAVAAQQQKLDQWKELKSPPNNDLESSSSSSNASTLASVNQCRTLNREQATRVSGKSGFLSALMDAAEELEPATRTVADGGVSKSCEGCANSSGPINSGDKKQQPIETKYARIVAEAAGKSRFNYAGGGAGDDDIPFYRKDLGTLLQECRASRKLVIMIVAIALLLDNMLLTSVVPIIPAYLFTLRMERELAANKTAAATMLRNKSGKFGSGQRMSVGNSDELDEEADSMSEYVNQSIANARDRYTGGFLTPRHKARVYDLNGNGIPDEEETMSHYDQDEDEDDDDDHNDDDDGNMNSDDANSDDTSNQNDPQARRKSHKKGPSDDYVASEKEDDEQEVSKKRVNMSKSANSKDVDGHDDDADKDNDDDDDDDEDRDKRRWMDARKSLLAAAKNGSDNRSLGGMCLNKVLGRMSDKNDNNDEDKDKQDADDANNNSKWRQNIATSKWKTNRPKRMARSKQRLAFMPTTSTTNRPHSNSTQRNKLGRKEKSLGANKTKVVRVGKKAQVLISHQAIVDESFEVGVMFASKPIVQAFANPFIGSLTNRVGFTIPMFTGFIIMFLSTLVFAFGSSYSTLFIARAIQGVGSACTSVAGMSMLADRFPDDAERGHAMAIALGGLALGVVIGPPFGGFMFEFVSKSSPFIVLAILALLDGLLQLMVLQPRVTKSQEEGASLLTLIKDPYILVAAGAITFANTGIAILEPALPLWMMETMQATNWQQGIAFLPAALSYMLGTNLFGNLGHKIGRWRSTMIGLILIGCSLLLIPFATRLEHLYIPNGVIGFAMGMVDSTMMPMLGYLVDIRHTSVYGSVYAIGDVAFCASFALGPALSGTLVELIGFSGLVVTTAFICFSFAPLLILLRNPPARLVSDYDDDLGEMSPRQQAALRYVNYANIDSQDETDLVNSPKNQLMTQTNNYVR